MHLNWILVTCLLVLLSVGLTTRTVDAGKKSKKDNEEEEDSRSTDTDSDDDDTDDADKKGKPSPSVPLLTDRTEPSVFICASRWSPVRVSVFFSFSFVSWYLSRVHPT